MTKLHFDDLTKITCPFGMLDDDTQRRLDDHVDAGGAIEGWRDCGWSLCGNGIWDKYITYRAKPQPKRPTTWVQFGGYVYRITRDEDGSNPTIELVETSSVAADNEVKGGKDE